MQAIEHNTPFAPAITWLNMSGDVTITWDDSNRDAILALVREKMAEGYSFFIITPRLLPIFGDKQVKLTDVAQLDKAKGVVVQDGLVADIVSRLDNANVTPLPQRPAAPAAPAQRLGDEAVEQAVKSGKAKLALVPKADLQATRRAASAEEVVQHQSVAVRPVVGG
jgi:hypothetical protein